MSRHGELIVVGKRVLAGEPITLASYEDGLLIATADDDGDEVEDTLAICECCFLEQTPAAAYVLQAARETGVWRAG